MYQLASHNIKLWLFDVYELCNELLCCFERLQVPSTCLGIHRLWLGLQGCFGGWDERKWLNGLFACLRCLSNKRWTGLAIPTFLTCLCRSMLQKSVWLRRTKTHTWVKQGIWRTRMLRKARASFPWPHSWAWYIHCISTRFPFHLIPFRRVPSRLNCGYNGSSYSNIDFVPQ